METVRKPKIASTLETDETLTITEEATIAPLELTPPETSLQQEPVKQEKTAKDIIDEAPELYGISPTVEQIEQFRQKESAWRNKLRNMI